MDWPLFDFASACLVMGLGIGTDVAIATAMRVKQLNDSRTILFWVIGVSLTHTLFPMIGYLLTYFSIQIVPFITPFVGLIAFYYFTSYIRNKTTVSLVISCFSYLLALLSKETAITYLPVFGLLIWFFSSSSDCFVCAVSHSVPAIHPKFAIKTQYSNHHPGFTEVRCVDPVAPGGGDGDVPMRCRPPRTIERARRPTPVHGQAAQPRDGAHRRQDCGDDLRRPAALTLAGRVGTPRFRGLGGAPPPATRVMS